MWRSFMILLLGGVWLGQVSPIAWAADSAKPGCSRPITIAASPLGKAMTISADEQTVGGLEREIFDIISRDTGCMFEYVVVPRVRAFLMLKQRQVDIVPDATRTPERDEGTLFVEMGKISPMLITLPKTRIEVASMEELTDSSLNVITIKGYDYGPGYRALLANPKMSNRVHETVAPDNALKMLMVGRAEAILMAPTMVADAWERLGDKSTLKVVELDDVPAIRFGHYLSLHRLTPGDLDTLHKGIQAVQRRGDIARLAPKYYPAWALETVKPTVRLKRRPE